MNDVIIKDNIEDLIYEIRGKQVMLDSALTRLYECVNKKAINLAVKRHINRITEKFMFQLTQEEFNIIPKFQVETLKAGTGIQRVLKTYKENVFEFFPNHIRATIPFNNNEFMIKENNTSYNPTERNENFEELSNHQNSMLKLIMDNPAITQDELARLLDVHKRTIIRNFKVLVENKYIERIGVNKKGYWKVLKQNNKQ